MIVKKAIDEIGRMGRSRKQNGDGVKSKRPRMGSGMSREIVKYG
jgi:hypothetical protein